jgi:phosphoribosyl-ATP pyrophosphohydrolase
MFVPNAEQATIEAPRQVRPFDQMVAILFKHMGSPAASLMHASVGISGEAGELVLAVATQDRTNIIEELGDARFYVQAVLNMYGWDLEAFSPEDYKAADNMIVAAPVPGTLPSFIMAVSFQVVAADVLDIVKKQWVYNKPLDEAALFDALGKLVSLYRGLLMLLSITEDTVQDHNRAKLAKRYPDGVYSDADAVARADKTEPVLLPAEPATMSNPAIEGNPPFIFTNNAA